MARARSINPRVVKLSALYCYNDSCLPIPNGKTILSDRFYEYMVNRLMYTGRVASTCGKFWDRQNRSRVPIIYLDLGKAMEIMSQPPVKPLDESHLYLAYKRFGRISPDVMTLRTHKVLYSGSADFDGLTVLFLKFTEYALICGHAKFINDYGTEWVAASPESASILYLLGYELKPLLRLIS